MATVYEQKTPDLSCSDQTASTHLHFSQVNRADCFKLLHANPTRLRTSSLQDFYLCHLPTAEIQAATSQLYEIERSRFGDTPGVSRSCRESLVSLPISH